MARERFLLKGDKKSYLNMNPIFCKNGLKYAKIDYYTEKCSYLNLFTVVNGFITSFSLTYKDWQILFKVKVCRCLINVATEINSVV